MNIEERRARLPTKVVLIFFDPEANKVKAEFEVKATGERFVRDELELTIRIQNGRRSGLDLIVEETALYLMRRMTTLIKEGYYDK